MLIDNGDQRLHTTSDGIVKGPATVILFLYTIIVTVRIWSFMILYIQISMSLSATNLWLQVALFSSPAVHSYGEEHSLSSQVWQMPFHSQ